MNTIAISNMAGARSGKYSSLKAKLKALVRPRFWPFTSRSRKSGSSSEQQPEQPVQSPCDPFDTQPPLPDLDRILSRMGGFNNIPETPEGVFRRGLASQSLDSMGDNLSMSLLEITRSNSSDLFATEPSLRRIPRVFLRMEELANIPQTPEAPASSRNSLASLSTEAMSDDSSMSFLEMAQLQPRPILHRKSKSGDLRSDYSGSERGVGASSNSSGLTSDGGSPRSSNKASDSADPNDATPFRLGEGKMYCCGRPFDLSFGDLMSCAACKYWFHLRCVGLEDSGIDFNERVTFFCPDCKHVLYQKTTGEEEKTGGEEEKTGGEEEKTTGEEEK